MSGVKVFQSAASGLALLAFAAAAPEAEAQTGSLGRNDPPICRTYERELANQRDYVGEANSRALGSAVTGLLGGYSNRSGAGQAGRVTQDMMRARTLQAQQDARISEHGSQCFAQREIRQAGECNTRTNEYASTPTQGGQVSGQARGSINEQRNCTSAYVQGSQGGSGYSGLTPPHR